MRGGGIGVVPPEPLELPQRTLVVGRRQQALREVVVKLRVFRIAGERDLEARGSVLEHPAAVVTHSQQRPRLHILRVEFQHRLERPSGSAETPALELGQAEVELDLRNVRIDGQNLAVADSRRIVLFRA